MLQHALAQALIWSRKEGRDQWRRTCTGSQLRQHLSGAMPDDISVFKISCPHLPPQTIEQSDSKAVNLNYVLISLSMGHNSLVFSDKADNEVISLQDSLVAVNLHLHNDIITSVEPVSGDPSILEKYRSAKMQKQ